MLKKLPKGLQTAATVRALREGDASLAAQPSGARGPEIAAEPAAKRARTGSGQAAAQAVAGPLRDSAPLDLTGSPAAARGAVPQGRKLPRGAGNNAPLNLIGDEPAGPAAAPAGAAMRPVDAAPKATACIDLT
jgi:hypothetical protein